MTVRRLTRIGDFPQLPELPPGFGIVQNQDLTYHASHHALSLGLGHTATREEAITLAWDSFREIDEEWHAWISAIRVILENSMDLPLDEIGLPTPVVKTLSLHGVQSLHGLARLTWPELLKMPNIGRRSIHKIQEVLARHNLKLNGSMLEAKSPSKCICGVLMDVVCTACGTHYCDVCDGNFCRACTVKTLGI